MVSGIREIIADSVYLECYRSPEQLAEQLAATVARELRRALQERNIATLAVSGGNTPKAFFCALSRRELAWERVVVTLVDERWLPPGHKHSNALLVNEHLLQNRARKARFMPLVNDCASPFEGVAEVELGLKELSLPFDVVILGMGSDGHTASLFPGADNLDQGLDVDSDRLCLALTPPAAPYDRITLTLAAILNSRFLGLHFEGKNKWRVFQKALGLASQTSYPIAAVLRQGKVPVHTFYAGDTE